MRILFILLALTLALSTAACGQRVYPKSPEGKLIPSSAH